jgi:HK97 family phage prohead protease
VGAATIEERCAGHQVRSFAFSEFEFRDDGPTGFTFEGVASVVDAPYQVNDQFGNFTETIRTGAFNKTLRDSKADVGLFVNHDYRSLPLATRHATGTGRLILSADPHLRVVAELNPARPSVQEARHAIADGQARQMSIGFTVPKDKRKDVWSEDFTKRDVYELALRETSIVWQGASPTTTSAVRSFDEFYDDITNLDMTEDEVRRAIAAFEARLPELPATVTDPFAERDRQDQERLERKKHSPAPAVL